MKNWWKREQQKNKRGRNRRRRGMTLIEIMVVMILGLIAGMVGINVVAAAARARVDRTKTDLQAIQGGLDLYKARHGKYPDTGTGLKALVDEGILPRTPKDSWDNDFLYMVEGGKAVVKSYGEDGQAGGEGNAADLSNLDVQGK